MQLVDLKGRRFGRLNVIRRDDNIGSATAWFCECDCGGTVTVRYLSLVRGETKSCGCILSEYMRERKTIHGHYNSRTYHSYHSMKARCLNKKHRQYKDYGGRGIKISKSWVNSFESFLKDMGERPKGKTIDRIDNNKGYNKNNCKWSTRKEQNNNKR